ncbi:hypothetical protein SLEP1_g4261 [Rubroshorea leprosula]|uniref:Uncharacterized protein n=1 Tax=Rubroshorea leprosula TaxID=152421 RepID=A0AAV5HSH9_9ROSI|nr:hypothetical protein SLEP1_g4261 [Rubroshorea leprosula]
MFQDELFFIVVAIGMVLEPQSPVAGSTYCYGAEVLVNIDVPTSKKDMEQSKEETKKLSLGFFIGLSWNPKVLNCFSYSSSLCGP